MFNFQAMTQPTHPSGAAGQGGLHAGGQDDPLAATQHLAQVVQINSILASTDSRAALPHSIFTQNSPARGQQPGRPFADAHTRNSHNGNHNAMQTEDGKALSGLLSSRASDGNAASENQTGMQSQRQKRKYRPVLVRNQKNPIAMGESQKLHQQRSLNRLNMDQSSVLASLDHSQTSLDKLLARRNHTGSQADIRALKIEQVDSCGRGNQDERLEPGTMYLQTSRVSGAGTPVGQPPGTVCYLNTHAAGSPEKRPPLGGQTVTSGPAQISREGPRSKTMALV